MFDTRDLMLFLSRYEGAVAGELRFLPQGEVQLAVGGARVELWIEGGILEGAVTEGMPETVRNLSPREVTSDWATFCTRVSHALVEAFPTSPHSLFVRDRFRLG